MVEHKVSALKGLMIVLQEGTGSTLRFNCLLIEYQYSRDRRWWGRRSCLIQEASNLERWWTNASKSILPIPRKLEGFKGEKVKGGGCNVQKKVPRQLVIFGHGTSP